MLEEDKLLMRIKSRYAESIHDVHVEKVNNFLRSVWYALEMDKDQERIIDPKDLLHDPLYSGEYYSLGKYRLTGGQYSSGKAFLSGNIRGRWVESREPVTNLIEIGATIEVFERMNWFERNWAWIRGEFGKAPYDNRW